MKYNVSHIPREYLKYMAKVTRQIAWQKKRKYFIFNKSKTERQHERQ